MSNSTDQFNNSTGEKIAHLNISWRYQVLQTPSLYNTTFLSFGPTTFQNIFIFITTATGIDLGSCDRASWAKCEDGKANKMQQLDVHY